MVAPGSFGRQRRSKRKRCQQDASFTPVTRVWTLWTAALLALTSPPAEGVVSPSGNSLSGSIKTLGFVISPFSSSSSSKELRSHKSDLAKTVMRVPAGTNKRVFNFPVSAIKLSKISCIVSENLVRASSAACWRPDMATSPSDPTAAESFVAIAYKIAEWILMRRFV